MRILDFRDARFENCENQQIFKKKIHLSRRFQWTNWVVLQSACRAGSETHQGKAERPFFLSVTGAQKTEKITFLPKVEIFNATFEAEGRLEPGT